MSAKANVALLFLLATMLTLALVLAAGARAQAPISPVTGKPVRPTVNYHYTVPGTIIEHYNPANPRAKRYARIPWRRYMP